MNDAPADPLAVPAIATLDGFLADARKRLAADVSAVDALREALQLAGEVQAELRHEPTLRQLLERGDEEAQARVRGLFERATTEGEHHP
jgi:hypothetical protein